MTTRSLELASHVFGVGKRRHDHAYAYLKTALGLEGLERAVRHAGDEVRDGHGEAVGLDADRRIAEARGELQRIDALSVDDAVDVDVADVALLGEFRFELRERRLEDAVGPAPVHAGAHLAGRGPDVAGKEQLGS